MPVKKNTKRAAIVAESGTPKRRIDEPPLSQDDLLNLVSSLIRRIRNQLQKAPDEDLHSLTGDLLKLVALQREIGPAPVEEVTVRWIENDQELPAEG